MKRLWILPLAALLCGRPVSPPRLKPSLSSATQPCQSNAQKYYLLAYAFREESPEKSRQYLNRAGEQLKPCEEPLLRARITELRSSFL